MRVLRVNWSFYGRIDPHDLYPDGGGSVMISTVRKYMRELFGEAAGVTRIGRGNFQTWLLIIHKDVRRATLIVEEPKRKGGRDA